jgi:aminodeoxyfutalosine deaminase
VRIFHADHLLPGDEPPIDDAVVLVDDFGTVLDVGPATALLPRHAGARIERVPGVVFPGLVNAHVHVELSALRGKVPGGRGFVAWVDELIAYRSEIAPDELVEAIDHAVADLVSFGTAVVGEITNSLAAVHALARGGIGGWIFHEVLGHDRAAVLRRIEGLRAELEEHVREWPSPDLAYAPSPHTLFTVHADAIRAVIDGVERRGLRTSVHLAEHATERRAIEHGDGPVADWYVMRTDQQPEWPRKSLFDYAESVGALSPHVLLVHLTDATREELARVASAGAPVVLCPRSNLFIEGRLPPLLAVLEAGIEPALGTDSLASNMSLDVLAEARALRERFPTVEPWRLFRMATWNGALALGRDDVGRIAKGARPGLYAVEGAAHGDPAGFLLAHTAAPRRRLAERSA